MVISRLELLLAKAMVEELRLADGDGLDCATEVNVEAPMLEDEDLELETL